MLSALTWTLALKVEDLGVLGFQRCAQRWPSDVSW